MNVLLDSKKDFYGMVDNEIKNVYNLRENKCRLIIGWENIYKFLTNYVRYTNDSYLL